MKEDNSIEHGYRFRVLRAQYLQNAIPIFVHLIFALNNGVKINERQKSFLFYVTSIAFGLPRSMYCFA